MGACSGTPSRMQIEETVKKEKEELEQLRCEMLNASFSSIDASVHNSVLELSPNFNRRNVPMCRSVTQTSIKSPMSQSFTIRRKGLVPEVRYFPREVKRRRWSSSTHY